MCPRFQSTSPPDPISEPYVFAIAIVRPRLGVTVRPLALDAVDVPCRVNI